MIEGSRILVAGGTGFLGVNLLKRLVDEKCFIRATKFTREPRYINSNIDYVYADLTNPEDCERIVKDIDYVFMCAAETSGASVMINSPLSHVTPNVIMNSLLLENSHKSGVKKFVFISSSAVYPDLGNYPVKEDEMFKGDPYDAYFSVGWMKRYTEILCDIYSRKISNPMSTLIIRPSNVYGPYDDFDLVTSHMIPALINKVVSRNNPLEVWGNGKDIRDFIFVDDFIDGIIQAFLIDRFFLQINLSSGTGYSVKEIVNSLVQIDNFENPNIQFDINKPSTIPIRLVDNSLAKKILNFKPRTSLNEGLSETLTWFKENIG